jgi:hypothetical protein
MFSSIFLLEIGALKVYLFEVKKDYSVLENNINHILRFS